MERILTLTQEQFNKFEKSKAKVKIAKALLGLPKNEKIGIGDTAAKISNSKPFEVYKDNWKGQVNYYIVIKPMDEELAITYSIYAM